jgi:hypothetical protein
MSMRTLDESDWSREVKPRGVGASLAILGVSVGLIVAPILWMVATMPNPVTVVDVVVVRHFLSGQIAGIVTDCAAQQAAVEKGTSPSTTPACAAVAPLTSSTAVPTRPAGR